MSNKRRPPLKPGDVVRLSKRGYKRYRYSGIGSETTMTVHSIQAYFGDPNDGRAVIKCNVIRKFGGKELGHSRRFRRRDLWFTGYNINGTVTANPVTLASIKCECNIWDGCSCGAFKREQELKK